MARHDPSKITCERRRPVKQVETDDFIVNDADNANLIWQRCDPVEIIRDPEFKLRLYVVEGLRLRIEVVDFRLPRNLVPHPTLV